ncbi:MAG TPA: aminomethyltransferase family protein [Phycisphaerae bacterium]|nr:aminomethyltransferase family protein [Phycisphaerae bacterium]
MSDQPLNQAILAAGARIEEVAGVRMAVDYGDPSGEYAAVRSGAALYAASDRGLIEVRGKDRAAWLHNLTTNAVKTLGPHEGNYAFALNVKGRVLFDLNVLALPDAFWLDIDRRFIARALAHFERYIITEDVQCQDRSGEFARIALCGPKAVDIVEALGVTQAGTMPALSTMPFAWPRGAGILPALSPQPGRAGILPASSPQPGRAGILPASTPPGEQESQEGSSTPPASLLVRHDFAGVFGVEFYLPTGAAAAFWNYLLELGRPMGLRPAGWHAVNTLRIEAGIPWNGHDIDEDVLPAETGQAERAVSYVKGCYLGQEVVERMRSRGVVANKLVGLRLGGQGVDDLLASVAAGPGLRREPGAGHSPSEAPATTLPVPRPALKAGETEVGRVTSICHSPALNAWIALGYVRLSYAAPATRLTLAGDPPVEAEVVLLPFRQ